MFHKWKPIECVVFSYYMHIIGQNVTSHYVGFTVQTQYFGVDSTLVKKTFVYIFSYVSLLFCKPCVQTWLLFLLFLKIALKSVFLRTYLPKPFHTEILQKLPVIQR